MQWQTQLLPSFTAAALTGTVGKQFSHHGFYWLQRPAQSTVWQDYENSLNPMSCWDACRPCEPVVFNLCVVTLLGVANQIFCISDVYIMINNSIKIQLWSNNKINYGGGHNNCIKESQHWRLRTIALDSSLPKIVKPLLALLPSRTKLSNLWRTCSLYYKTFKTKQKQKKRQKLPILFKLVSSFLDVYSRQGNA